MMEPVHSSASQDSPNYKDKFSLEYFILKSLKDKLTIKTVKFDLEHSFLHEGSLKNYDNHALINME